MPTCKEIRIPTTTTTTTTTTTSLPAITIDLTKEFTSSSDSSLPNIHYISPNRTSITTQYDKNKIESIRPKMPLSTSSNSYSTSSSSIYTTEQPTVMYSSTQRPNKNKQSSQSSSTAKPTVNTIIPSTTTNYNNNINNLGSSSVINNKKISSSQSTPGKNSNYNNKVPNIVTKNTSEKIDGINSFSRKSTSPKAKFNIVGIIALAIFGSFVFLAAIITIVIIVFRR